MSRPPNERTAAFDRLARLAAAAVGATSAAVTLGDAPAPVAGALDVPVLGADGSVLGTVRVLAEGRTWTDEDVDLLRDVAACVRAELELADARREQRIGEAVMIVATDCLVRLTADGTIEGWSPSAERTFGFTEAQAVGRSLAALLSPPDKEERYTAALRAALSGDSDDLGRVEVVAARSDGHRLPVEITLVPAGADEFVAGLRDLTELRDAEERVEAAERRFRTLVEHVPAVTYTCDYDELGYIHYVSPQIEEMTGRPAADFLGDPVAWLEIVHPEDRERVDREIEDSFAAEQPFDCEYRIVARDGTVRWVWDRETIVRDAHGTAIHGQGVIVDLTPVREAQEALQLAERQLESIIAVAPMILTAIDADGIVTFCDGQGLDTAGVRAEQIVGRHASALVPSESGQEAIRRALAGETSSATIGEGDVCFDVTWQPTRGDDGSVQGIVAVGLDVSARRENEARLRHLAHHDPLTGAPNRMQLELEIAQRAGEIAVIVVDVDNFKRVNDSLGHAAGDEVLRELARRLTAVARARNAFLARPGADEFTFVVGSGAGGDLRRDTEALGRAALHAIREPIAAHGSEFVVSATTGAAIGVPDAAELLRHADVALGEAKRRGLTLAWYEGERGDARGRLTLTARIRGALARGEFRLVYQPIVDLHSGECSGVEALIRWDDPERGLVSPDEFIPAAEASGLIDEVGRWVVDEVCRQWRAWADEGLFPSVAFNVAPRELRRDDFARALVRSAERHGADPHRLVVEITERAAMREPERTDAVLRELNAAGVRVAIDDFGADHSSLARLRDLRVDLLKIDRSFLHGVPQAPDAAAIVTAIVSLAGALGMDAVAEGVETAEQLRFLDAQGCRRAQGYHLAMPMPSRQATEFLRARGPWGRLRQAA